MWRSVNIDFYSGYQFAFLLSVNDFFSHINANTLPFWLVWHEITKFTLDFPHVES